MIRSLFAYLFWAAAALLSALALFPLALITGNIMPLYRTGTWIAWTGIHLSGVRVRVEGLDCLDPNRVYIFLSNHASNLDPPILLPLIPHRASVLTKAELFRIPILGRAMHMAKLVPIDRRDREKAIASVRAAKDVLGQGINVMVFVEGTRSPDGRLLPFKKGPFHLAVETGVPIVPVTIVGTHELQPKGQLFWGAGQVKVVFHNPVIPNDYPDRSALMAVVRDRIASALPESSR